MQPKTVWQGQLGEGGSDVDRLRDLVRVARQIFHDINNTITPLSLDTELMLEEQGLAEPMREYLEGVQRAIDDVSEAIARMHATTAGREPDVHAPLPGQTNGRGLHVLIVDDDAAILDSLRAVVELEGHRVTTADSGHAALDAFRTAMYAGAPIDVVITDLGMPKMDGWQVARALKAQKPRLQVILLSGWNQQQPQASEAMPEIDYMLAKPPQLAELHKALGYCATRLKWDDAV